MITYELPKSWISYNRLDVKLAEAYAEAKASVLALTMVPCQRRWVEELQAVELKREVAGTSRIEGAEFTEQELDQALQETPDQLFTRSQRQARAVVKAYRWIAELPRDRPLTRDLILDIHRTIVTDADDDHCPPGKLRKENLNVLFGVPQHRGVEGGEECDGAFRQLCEAIHKEYQSHDPIIQALATHYHLAAMHPFLDGNGRTARALEALMLQRAGLHDTCFIAMSNYYYDEKRTYLATLAKVRQADHDLTSFLIFGLRGIALQSQRLLVQIRKHISRALYRNIMYELFGRLKSQRRRVIAERQIEILKILLEADSLKMDYEQLTEATASAYRALKKPVLGLVRDILSLQELRAVDIKQTGEDRYDIAVRLEWPSEITETEFFAKTKELPQGKNAFIFPLDIRRLSSNSRKRNRSGSGLPASMSFTRSRFSLSVRFISSNPM